MEGEVGGGSLPFVLSLLSLFFVPVCLLQSHVHLLTLPGTPVGTHAKFL